MPQTRRHPFRLILSLWLGLCFLVAALPAAAFDTKALHAWVYDLTTHTVLLDKDGEAPVPPASMSKLMTVDMLFEALRDRRVTLDTTFPVSAHAISFTKAGGSTMYLQENDRPTVEELIHGMIINSGNDACVVVAEGLAGSEEAFARQMTERARQIGLEQSTFTNASGWPDPGQRMSMKDLALLGARLIEEFPTLYPVFSQTEFNYKDRAPANANNRNPLLKLNIGADGLKTGHTEEAGFGMVGSVKQGDRRIIFAISGLQSDKERAQEAERIAQWAFRDFALKTLVPAGQKVADAPVFLGAADQVGLVAAHDVRALLPALTQGPVPAEVRYVGPVDAPVAKGQKVGTLTLTPPGLPPQTVDLVAEADVAKGGYLKRLSTAFHQVMGRIRAEIGS
mgnify:CR=1 FL=1